jgi:hypothetical protein
MRETSLKSQVVHDLLEKIREGMTVGIRQEVERRRRLGIPLYVERDGKVEAVMADGTPVLTVQ